MDFDRSDRAESAEPPASPRVLVVDDDAGIRESIMETLEDHGYQPIGAANGREALDLLHEADPPPSLILLDLMMPVMDGWSFREEQLKSPELASIPVVAISAYQDVAEQAEWLRVDYLSKPLKLERLLRVARQYCHWPVA
jgi:CheY-like chemotaxis protein